MSGVKALPAGEMVRIGRELASNKSSFIAAIGTVLVYADYKYQRKTLITYKQVLIGHTPEWIWL